MCKKSPIISIIVAIYNVEQYLKKCVDSILTQSFTDFECILVNDGSFDNCPAICDFYLMIDNRIKVIHKLNGGVSSARNAGLNIAKGEWISFVDGDDWCDPEMIGFLLQNAISNGADISICGHRSVSDTAIRYTSKKHNNIVLKNRDAIIKLFSRNYYGGGVCGKLINKALISCGRNIINFDETIQFGEDRLFNFYIFKKAKKIFYSPSVYYNYYYRNNSICNTKYPTPELKSEFKAISKMLNTEKDKAIIKMLYLKCGQLALQLCFLYLKNEELNLDAEFYCLRKVVLNNKWYLLFYGSIKVKILCALIFFPTILYYLYKIKLPVNRFINKGTHYFKNMKRNLIQDIQSNSK